MKTQTEKTKQKLITTDYAIFDEKGQMRGTFQEKEKAIAYAQEIENSQLYMIRTYKIITSKN